jgi:putative addiction module component (TIGR02574 family)
MSETAEKLAKTLLALPEADRLALANMLFDSLPPPPGMMSEDDPGFEEELDRRLRDHESGKSKGIPADEFFRQLRERRA